MPQDSAKRSSHAGVRTLAAVGAGAIVLYGSRVLLNLFGPPLPYTMRHVPGKSIDSEEFLYFLSLVTDAAVRRCSRVSVLKNGTEFYPAELEAIRRAEHTVNLQYYEFMDGRIASEILTALAERARHGVQVRIMADALGSFQPGTKMFEGLKKAGGQMRWYNPVRWDSWQRANNRTHRKLLIVDGRTGFIGGAGIADHWLYATPGTPPWRDTVFCVEGEAVGGLTSTFSENWLEASGEILSDPAQFAVTNGHEGSPSLVVSSTPKSGGTRARILFQALIESAAHSIRITTPYFLPDPAARHGLERAIRERGVRVQILVAGPHIDHPAVRRLSRHSSRHLLMAGAEVYEYQPAMLHAKIMTIDGNWSIVGSTNFDHRSFALNYEVNLAAKDPELAARLDQDFATDLEKSRRLTLAMLRERTMWGRVSETVSEVFQEEE